jgi:D-tyrosyl-tRNA(Tyr) deacylase
MKVVIQRVTRASVHVEGKTVGQIEYGLLALLGVAKAMGSRMASILLRRFVRSGSFPMSRGR